MSLRCFTWVGLPPYVINQTNAVIAAKTGGNAHRVTGQLARPTPQIHKHTKKESRRKQIRVFRVDIHAANQPGWVVGWGAA